MGYFFSILIGTFVLEDLALASSLVLVAEAKLSLLEAFSACFLGISIGDLGLFFLGRLLSHFQIESRIHFLKKYKSGFDKMKTSSAVTAAVVCSRVVPGTRVPTYIGAGFVGFSFLRFLLLTVVTVAVWVGATLLGGHTLSRIFADHWIYTVISFVIALKVLKALSPVVLDKWSRKAWWPSWRQWQYFEFWPAWLFYLPIVPYYIFLALKYRTLFAPFYVSPQLKNGGLIGESKWDFLKHLHERESSTLATILISKERNFLEVKALLDEAGIQFPFILKPDVGQRGFGVRVIRTEIELADYLKQAEFNRIAQRLSVYENEAGLFYVREPHQTNGFIFSITDKKFPSVRGDGVRRLGDLILDDPRARIIAQVYFARLKDELDRIPKRDEKVILSECGNHCQGAIFKNGENMITPSLTFQLDRIAKQIPEFYFGRFDVRYRDRDSLMRGEGFEIVEVNGASSEATHIWDAQTSIRAAYRTLFQQWELVFRIGSAVSKTHPVRIHLFAFLFECLRVFFRKENLSISS